MMMLALLACLTVTAVAQADMHLRLPECMDLVPGSQGAPVDCESRSSDGAGTAPARAEDTRGLPCSGIEGIQELKERHASRLATVSEQAIGARLLTDADRLMHEAALWDPTLKTLTTLKTALREALVASARGSEAESYREFWSSTGYEAARRKLLASEADARGATLADLEKLATELAASQSTEDLDAVIRFALELGLDEGRWERRVGKSRLARLQEERAQELSIDRLELGNAVVGPQADIAKLQGKVVLWRSFSL